MKRLVLAVALLAVMAIGCGKQEPTPPSTPSRAAGAAHDPTGHPVHAVDIAALRLSSAVDMKPLYLWDEVAGEGFALAHALQAP